VVVVSFRPIIFLVSGFPNGSLTIRWHSLHGADGRESGGAEGAYPGTVPTKLTAPPYPIDYGK